MIFLISIYVCFSATGLVLIKMGTSQGFGIALSKGVFRLELGSLLLVGLTLYITSFLLSMVVMSKMNLTFFYPLLQD